MARTTPLVTNKTPYHHFVQFTETEISAGRWREIIRSTLYTLAHM